MRAKSFKGYRNTNTVLRRRESQYQGGSSFVRHKNESVNAAISSVSFVLGKFYCCFFLWSVKLASHTANIRIRSLRNWWFLTLSPNIHIQIGSNRISIHFLEEVVERIWTNDQSIFLEVLIILLDLITFSFDNVLVLLGENWCWSLLGLKLG